MWLQSLKLVATFEDDHLSGTTLMSELTTLRSRAGPYGCKSLFGKGDRLQWSGFADSGFANLGFANFWLRQLRLRQLRLRHWLRHRIGRYVCCIPQLFANN